jgi:hypothetical protein
MVVLGDHSFCPNREDSLEGWRIEIADSSEEDIELDNFSFPRQELLQCK